jgi:hypothetical protein
VGPAKTTHRTAEPAEATTRLTSTAEAGDLTPVATLRVASAIDLRGPAATAPRPYLQMWRRRHFTLQPPGVRSIRKSHVMPWGDGPTENNTTAVLPSAE